MTPTPRRYLRCKRKCGGWIKTRLPGGSRTAGRFPDWLASALGNLNLPLLAARTLVADVGVFVVAQLAIAETERRSVSLGLSHGADLAAFGRSLRFPIQLSKNFGQLRRFRKKRKKSRRVYWTRTRTRFRWLRTC